MSNTKHTCYTTRTSLRASDVAAACLALFPFATLMALVFWGEWLIPYFAN